MELLNFVFQRLFYLYSAPHEPKLETLSNYTAYENICHPLVLQLFGLRYIQIFH